MSKNLLSVFEDAIELLLQEEKYELCKKLHDYSIIIELETKQNELQKLNN